MKHYLDNGAEALLWTLLRIFIVISIAVPAISQEREFWEAEAFYCDAGTSPFPSKEPQVAGQKCDDGDMALFGGILCYAGDERGCDLVASSQDATGRWWRSPRRHGWEWPEHDVSFSRDQSLGVLLYLATMKDVTKFRRWIGWLESNRPCLVEIDGTCLKEGWLRFCRDDHDNRCTFRPADCVRFESLANILHTKFDLCRTVMKELGLDPNELLPLEDFVLGSAIVNDPGYPMHLAGAAVLLSRALENSSNKIDLAASTLALREPDNPFFLFLASQLVKSRNLMTSSCPGVKRPSENRHQWTWERVPKDQAWRESMYWECIALDMLLLAQDN